MNYYYYGDEHEYGIFSPSRYFSSPEGFTLKPSHKRILFTLVALYLSYRLSFYLFNMFSSLFRWWTKSAELEEQPILPQSRIGRFFEGAFVAFFGLAIGAVAYYTHQQQSTKLLEAATVVYSKIVNQIVYHSTGFDLTRSSLNQNETLVLGTLLAGFTLYIMYSMVRFLLYHYIFGVGLSLLGLFLYFYQFPITADTAQTYSGTMFVIDRRQQFAYLVPSLIPKVLLTVTIGYYLVLVFLKSFSLFLKISFRFLLYSVIATILLNSVTTLISQPIPASSTTTTFTPNHRY